MTHPRGMWSLTTLTRYWILQLPAILFLAMLLFWARQANIVSTSLMFIILFLWIAKDAILYPFLWKAYDPSSRDIRNQLIGKIGEAKEPLNPVGYIQVNGELWQAQVSHSHTPLRKGERVRVFGIEGLTLLVQPAEHSKDNASH